jgi:hypothetical protein
MRCCRIRHSWPSPESRLADHVATKESSRPGSVAPCSPPSRCGLARAELVAQAPRRPTLTAAARGACAQSRSGRRNAAVEQRNSPNRQVPNAQGKHQHDITQNDLLTIQAPYKDDGSTVRAGVARPPGPGRRARSGHGLWPVGRRMALCRERHLKLIPRLRADARLRGPSGRTPVFAGHQGGRPSSRAMVCIKLTETCASA